MPRPVTSQTPVLPVLPSLPGVCSHQEREESWRQEAQRARDHRKHIPGRQRAFDERDIGWPTLWAVFCERMWLHIFLLSCLPGVSGSRTGRGPAYKSRPREPAV